MIVEMGYSIRHIEGQSVIWTGAAVCNCCIAHELITRLWMGEISILQAHVYCEELNKQLLHGEPPWLLETQLETE